MGLGKFSGIAMTLVLSIHSRMSLLPIEHHLRRSFMFSAYAPANYGVILERVERAASCALGADNYEPGLGLDGYLQDFANFVHAVKAGVDVVLGKGSRGDHSVRTLYRTFGRAYGVLPALWAAKG